MNLALVSNKVLITGIDSFTGMHLSSYLETKGYRVYGTVLKEGDGFKTFTCNITCKQECIDVMSCVKPDCVIHLAGIAFVGHDNNEAFYEVNTLGTQNILDALIETNCKIQKVILASSATVYGDQGSEVLNESMCPMPTNHYGMSKLAMEHMARNYFKKLPILIVRPFNYTGVGQAEHFLVPKIVSHFKQKALHIELGNLYVEREFNDVFFTCNVYVRLLESEVISEIVNICSGTAISLMDIIDTMDSLARYRITVEVNPLFIREHEIKRLVGSITKLESIVGKIVPIPLIQTLSNMYEA